ncbi:glutamine synthetase family protein [Rhodospirillum sp. A1_3_36]|uniref:glutamine synthetase family protein n=1 Tax=Rhodospirillum sp. A1_3_36 TaxID=3391666 RepID=UPI0039A60D1E
MTMKTLVENHGLWSTEQEEAARRLEAEIGAGTIEVVRFLFVDQHGLPRGKALVGQAAAKALRRGVTMATTMVLKDTSHRTVFPVFTSSGALELPRMRGAADMLMVADPSTWRVLPWARKTAWVLCDLHFADGTALPYCTRGVARKALGDLKAMGYDMVAGLEVEFHLFRAPDRAITPAHTGQPGTPPDVTLLSTGAQYLTEVTYDAVDPIMDKLRANLEALGLPLVSMEVEFGPSQFEFTFAPTVGLDTCDNMVMFRTAMKEVCRREGLHVTFMCRPKLENVASSGWHLHQSLIDANGRNMFMTEAGETRTGGEDDLSEIGRHYLGGLLAHGRGAAIMGAPTINAYKRYRPYSLAPDRVVWGRDNRGAMIRLIGGPGDPATRLENRVGEPAANPYLYLASQAISGRDGLRRKLEPGPGADVPYETDCPTLPHSLPEAVAALRADPVIVDGFGEGFIEYYTRIKEAEIRRFELDVTEWEHREYFDLF